MFLLNFLKISLNLQPAAVSAAPEVDEDVAMRFRQFPGAVSPGKEPGKYQLELREVNRQILLGAGVRAERIAVADSDFAERIMMGILLCSRIFRVARIPSSRQQ